MSTRVSLDVLNYWGTASTLIGLQFILLHWRIQREANFIRDGQDAWLPPSDIFGLCSIVLGVFVMFVLPQLCSVGNYVFEKAIGAYSIAILGHVFGLIGHYNLYTRRKKLKKKPADGNVGQTRGTVQEYIALAMFVLLILLFLFI